MSRAFRLGVEATIAVLLGASWGYMLASTWLHVIWYGREAFDYVDPLILARAMIAYGPGNLPSALVTNSLLLFPTNVFLLLWATVRWPLQHGDLGRR
ncbi:MAG: hypothetical protein AAF577_13735 [Pseudomonadota bacterium]